MPLSVAARALARRCEPRVNELARRMARESFEALPGYAELPDDVRIWRSPERPGTASACS
ncbi:hypothetical protein [Streptomyces sp. NPDC048309]|uniref:hypothetical protein n=1 Tax=Streptomyces sp. NPDC048309 TaxID=3154618 RepID=UPI00340A4AA7